MLRTLLRAALMAALLTGGILLAPTAADAKPSAGGNGGSKPANVRGPIKNPQTTVCNVNNRKGGGCPKKLGSSLNSPVCRKGRHTHNPHCQTPTVNRPPTPGPGVSGNNNGTSGGTRASVRGAQVRVAQAAAVPRANRSTAPGSGRVVAKAGSAL